MHRVFTHADACLFSVFLEDHSRVLQATSVPGFPLRRSYRACLKKMEHTQPLGLDVFLNS